HADQSLAAQRAARDAQSGFGTVRTAAAVGHRRGGRYGQLPVSEHSTPVATLGARAWTAQRVPDPSSEEVQEPAPLHASPLRLGKTTAGAVISQPIEELADGHEPAVSLAQALEQVGTLVVDAAFAHEPLAEMRGDDGNAIPALELLLRVQPQEMIELDAVLGVRRREP